MHQHTFLTFLPTLPFPFFNKILQVQYLHQDSSFISFSSKIFCSLVSETQLPKLIFTPRSLWSFITNDITTKSEDPGSRYRRSSSFLSHTTSRSDEDQQDSKSFSCLSRSAPEDHREGMENIHAREVVVAPLSLLAAIRQAYGFIIYTQLIRIN